MFESPRSKVQRLRKELATHPRRVQIGLVEVPAFAEKLRQQHPDYEKYAVYHALIDSGYGPEQQMIEKDFEREYSVIAFLEQALKNPDR